MRAKRLFLLGSLAALTALGLGASGVAVAGPAAGRSAVDVRYRLVDLGTLGGPNSAEDPEFPFVNNRGLVVGFADTAQPDPNHPGGHVFHAFRWHGGPIKDLGTLPGGLNSFADWSNSSGQIVGFSENGKINPLLGAPEGRAVLWRPSGRIVDLGTLGGNESLATAVNDRGQIVGPAANAKPDPFSMFGWATQTRAFLWQKGRMADLGTLGGPDAAALFINARAQVAGASYTNLTPNPVTERPTLDPFLWENGLMVDLGTLGGNEGFPAALNSRGQVVGQSNLAGDQTAHPFLWSRGKLIDLGTFGGTFGTANGLNDAGEVVGGAGTATSAFHAFFWHDGRMTDIGTVRGDTCSVARWVNASGQTVGTSGECGGQFMKHAFLSDRGGRLIDLNRFVPAGSDLTVVDGETINDSGEIAGTGLLPNGDFHAVVLKPCNDGHQRDVGCRSARAQDDRQPRTDASAGAAGRSFWSALSESPAVAGNRPRLQRR